MRVSEVVEGFAGRPVPGDPAAGGEQQQPVAEVETEHAVGDHDDGSAVVGEAAQHLHDGAVHAGVESAGGFVEEQQGRLGEQFEGDADALALAAGEAGDDLVAAGCEAEFVDHLGDAGGAFGGRGVIGEAQFGGVGEGLPDGQLGVQDVVLRNQSDALAQFGVVAVQVAAVVADGSAVGGAQPGERVEQGGFAGAAGSGDGEQALLADREGDVVEQGAVAVDLDGQVGDVEVDVTGVDEFLEFVADQAEHRVSDTDQVAGPDGRPEHGLAVEVGAVVAVQVGDLVAAVGPGP